MSRVSSRERPPRQTSQPVPSPSPLAAGPTPGDPSAHARFGHRLTELAVFPESADASDSVTGLPDALQTNMEALSGLSLDGVRVHANSDRPADVGALAFAQGGDIHLGPGQERHLAHEAWHVVQQKQGRATGLQAKDDKPPAEGGLEKEADVFGMLAGAIGIPGGSLAGMGEMLVGAGGNLMEAVQRQLDRQKMAGMLKVVSDDADPKTRKPNEVTQAEFDKYAGVYSDIRSDKSSLKIDGGVDGAHKGAMLDDIAKILQTQSGRTLVGDLSAGGKDKEVTLGLSKNDDGSLNRVGAETESAEYYGASDPTKGVGSTIKYVPGAEGEMGKGRNEVKGADGKVTAAYDMPADFMSDTVLFHEMTHAYHNAHGTAKKMPWPSQGEAGETVSQADADAEVLAGHSGAANDVGIGKEEWATTGMGAYHNDAITENAYRKEQRILSPDSYAYEERTRYTADEAPLVLPPPELVRHEEDEK